MVWSSWADSVVGSSKRDRLYPTHGATTTTAARPAAPSWGAHPTRPRTGPPARAPRWRHHTRGTASRGPSRIDSDRTRAATPITTPKVSGAAQRRPVPPAVRRPQDRGGGGDHHRLGYHHGVEVEDVGAEGGEHGRDQPDPLAGDAAPGDAHGGDAGGADQARDDLVLEERPEAQPGEAGQHGHEAGRVVRARHAHAEEQELVRVHVPLAVGEQVGALVVVVRIADDRPRAAPTHEVDEAHGEAGGGDAGEPPPEPADARARRVGRGPCGALGVGPRGTGVGLT